MGVYVRVGMYVYACVREFMYVYVCVCACDFANAYGKCHTNPTQHVQNVYMYVTPAITNKAFE